MALSFTSGTNYVNIGNDTSVNDLTSFTWLLWAKFDDLTPAATRFVMLKGGGGPDNLALLFSGHLTYSRDFSITDGSVSYDVGAAHTAGDWLFIALVLDGLNDPTLSVGTLSTVVADGSESQVTPVGTIVSKAANNLRYGGTGNSNQGTEGDIGFVGVWNRALSLGEMKQQQFHPHVTSGCVVFQYPGWTGLTTVTDLSGNTANNGTLTNSPTQAPHVPLGPAFGYDVGLPYEVAVAASTGSQRMALMGVGV